MATEEELEDPEALNEIEKGEDRDGQMMSDDPDNSNGQQTQKVGGSEGRFDGRGTSEENRGPERNLTENNEAPARGTQEEESRKPHFDEE